MSDALRTGKAAWALDVETIHAMRVRNVALIGILCPDEELVCWTRRVDFETKAERLDFSKVKGQRGKYGADQLYLNLSEFKTIAYPKKRSRSRR